MTAAQGHQRSAPEGADPTRPNSAQMSLTDTAPEIPRATMCGCAACRTPMDLDTQRVSSARVWDYLCGGKDNYPVDRRIAGSMARSWPLRAGIEATRRHSETAVMTAVRAGVTQVVEIGPGLPGPLPLHAVAQHYVRQARVVYVDCDAQVITHGRAQTKSDQGPVTWVAGDLSHPLCLLRQLYAPEAMLDWSRPVAVVASSVLEDLADHHATVAAIKQIMHATAPGSYLSISGLLDDGSEGIADSVLEANTQGLAWRPRTPDQTHDYFIGLQVLACARLTAPATAWQLPNTTKEYTDAHAWGALARKTGKHDREGC